MLVRRALTVASDDRCDVWLIAAGKAAVPMARAAVDALASRLRGGLVVAPVRADVPPPLASIAGEHPQPGAGSEEAGRRALALAADVSPEAELLVLLSGGASSLLAVPAPGVTLDDKRAATGVLLRSGADIFALNTVRKHLSAIKGGRLAAACRAACHALVLSDVVGDDLSVIASGPTVADATTFGDAWRVIEAYGGAEVFPPRIAALLAAGVRGELDESPKPGDRRLARARTEVIGGRHDAMRGAAEEAARLGYSVRVLAEPLVGEARHAGPSYLRRALDMASSLARPACVIASGETTVHVRGAGRGGRNQEVVLAAAEVIDGRAGSMALASAGTDGIDGPTDAAGAVADSTTVARARAAGLPSPQACLDDNDTYAYFDALGDLIRTGPTGTNVGDLQIFLLA
jgi:glycerate 2-kinase